MTKLVKDVTKGRIKSAYVGAPFDEAKAELERNDYRIISANENAKLRIQEGISSDVSRYGNYTREGFIYVPGENTVRFVKYSPVLSSAKQATQAHRQGEEFYPSKEQVEKALKNSVKISYTKKPIPTNRFGDDEITVFAFGKQARLYGDFLRDNKIRETPVWLVNGERVNKQSKPFVRQLGLYYADPVYDGRSGLDGDGRGLYCGSRVRGVLKKASEAGSQRVLPYTQRDVDRAEKIISGVREGRLPASKLEKALDFLGKLRE